MINEVLYNLIHEYIIVYVSDISIYSEIEAEYIALIKGVLQRLGKAHSCMSFKKSQVHVKEVE